MIKWTDFQPMHTDSESRFLSNKFFSAICWICNAQYSNLGVFGVRQFIFSKNNFAFIFQRFLNSAKKSKNKFFKILLKTYFGQNWWYTNNLILNLIKNNFKRRKRCSTLKIHLWKKLKLSVFIKNSPYRLE